VEFITCGPRSPTPVRPSSGTAFIFERKVQVGSDAQIGDFVTILSMSVIGHDVSVGDYVEIGSFYL
jgi:UDP-3-O-[3-hydroxymyristoyl] glucosamine N-acyltransferase